MISKLCLYEYICAVSALFAEEEGSHDCARWVQEFLPSVLIHLVNEDTSDFAIGEGWSSMVPKQRRIFLWLTRPWRAMKQLCSRSALAVGSGKDSAA